MKKYLKRHLGPKLVQWARQYPVVTLTGPRQSGQTPHAEWGETLMRISAAFPDTPQLCVVYGGASDQMRGGVRFVPWRSIDSLFV